MTDEQTEKDIEDARRSPFPPPMTDEEYDKAFDEAFERVQNAPATIQAPESTDRANKVAEWLSEPVRMLADLTETLNALLEHCFYRLGDYGNGPETTLDVIPSHFDEWNLLDIFVHLLFEQDAARLRIRNGIEPTPFSIDVIQAVEQNFQTLTRAFHNNERGSRDSEVKFTNAVERYKTELEILADWIEARAIFQGKKQPKSNPTNKNSATDNEIVDVFRMMDKSGLKPTNNLIKEYFNGLGKTVGSDRVQKGRTEWIRRRRTPDPR